MKPQEIKRKIEKPKGIEGIVLNIKTIGNGTKLNINGSEVIIPCKIHQRAVLGERVSYKQCFYAGEIDSDSVWGNNQDIIIENRGYSLTVLTGGMKNLEYKANNSKRIRIE